MKTSNEAIGIKPQTFRLVAQCRSQLRHRVARIKVKAENISVTEVSSSQGAQNLDCSSESRRRAFWTVTSKDRGG
jgi:hypothetical protein